MHSLQHNRHYVRVLLILVGCLIFAGCSLKSSAEDNKRSAPSIELAGLNQETLYTADVTKPMVLNFWASWCPYCNEEIPILDALYEEYKDRIEFVSINITYDDSVSLAKSFVDKYQLQMPVYLDLDGLASGSFRVQAVPTFVTVDEQGTIITHRTGAIGKQAEAEYRKQLDALLSASQ